MNRFWLDEKNDTHSYKGWLNSDDSLKRAFGVLGYLIYGYIMILVIFGLLAMSASILVSILGI
jgi:hypothetical protein